MGVTGVVASLGHDEPNEVCGVVGVVGRAAPPSVIAAEMVEGWGGLKGVWGFSGPKFEGCGSF